MRFCLDAERFEESCPFHADASFGGRLELECFLNLRLDNYVWKGEVTMRLPIRPGGRGIGFSDLFLGCPIRVRRC